MTRSEKRLQRRARRRRKTAAVLSAGIVLGTGGIVTLASWNDSEYAKGTFTAGVFDLEGSLDGTTYAQHASSGAAANLAFTVPVSLLTPTDVVYAPLAIRLAANTTNNANVTLSTPTTTGTVTNLTYTLVKTSSITCNAGAISGGTVLGSAGSLLTVGSGTFTLNMGSPVTAAGAPQYLCFAVTAGAGLAQGQTGTATWQFTATST